MVCAKAVFYAIEKYFLLSIMCKINFTVLN